MIDKNGIKIPPAPGKTDKNGLPDFSILNYHSLPEVAVNKTQQFRRIFLKFLFYVGIPVYILTRYFLYIDLPNSCFVTIRPSIMSFSNLEMKRGLVLLKRVLPDKYSQVCSRVSSIDPNFGCGGFGGGCFFPSEQSSYNKGVITISTDPDNTAWTASVIVHETCHAIQYNERRDFIETECHQEGDKVLKELVQY